MYFQGFVFRKEPKTQKYLIYNYMWALKSLKHNI